MFIVGIDPGPTVGVALLSLSAADAGPGGRPRLVRVEALQCTPGLLGSVMHGLSSYHPTIAIERFVVGPRTARSGTARAGETARDIVSFMVRWAIERDAECYARSASEVKPWATDTRLERAGLLAITKGMGHARDAARHALFTAVQVGKLADPLSTRAGA